MTKKLIIISIITLLLLPLMKVNYYNGNTIEVKRTSTVGLIIQDIIDGTVGTTL